MKRTTQRLLGAGLGLSLAFAGGAACTGGESNRPEGQKPGSRASSAPFSPGAPGGKGTECAARVEYLYEEAYPVRYVGAAGIILDQKRATEVTLKAAEAAASYLKEHERSETPVRVDGKAIARGTLRQVRAASADREKTGVLWVMANSAANAVMDAANVDFGLRTDVLLMNPAVEAPTMGHFHLAPTAQTGWMSIELRGVEACTPASPPQQV